VSTSLLDLTQAAAQLTAPGATLAPDAAARSLAIIGEVFPRLCRDGLDGRYGGPRHEPSLLLAVACERAASQFPQTDGRLPQLLGVTGDVLGVLQQELTQSDRWWAAIGLADIARRCAKAISDSGPYADAVALAEVRQHAAAVIVTGATDPPHPARLIGVDRPVPAALTPKGLEPGNAVFEHFAALTALMRSPARPPLSVRQLTAVTLAATDLARAAVDVAEQLGPEQSTSSLARSAMAWRASARGIVKLASAVETADLVGDRVLQHVAGIRASFDRLEAQAPAESGKGMGTATGRDLLRATRLLPGLASDIARDIRMQTGRIVVPHSAKPHSALRLAEWKARKAFIANRIDLHPTLDALRIATHRPRLGPDLEAHASERQLGR
jgi:hypothetical protein